MENREVARILRETAQLLEIDGAMIGRYRSYERVAELLNGLPESIEELARDRRWEFAFICAPLKFQGATGSPIRPLALVV